MKLYYTPIENNLTDFLAEEAKRYAQEGRQVFYIAPNSLSFEKEKTVLQHLPNRVSLNVLVTRFGQLSRYFVWEQTETEEQPIEDRGLRLLFYRVLSTLTDDQLRVYAKVKNDMAFIDQLVSLYKELLRSGLTVADLTAMDSEEKQADLSLIFSTFLELLGQKRYEQQTKVSRFRQLVDQGQLDQQLVNVVVIVDGFSQFTADELALIESLHGRVAEVVIATYASKKAMQAAYIEGSVYQAGVAFLGSLSARFGCSAQFLSLDPVAPPFQEISRAVEGVYAYTHLESPFSKEAQSALSIWELPTEKDEVEEVARSIRGLLHEGVRYKDILVLLGDEASYQLPLQTIFARYDIPFYLGRAEEMSHHPLVHLMDSLSRIKRYGYRAEDVVNLLKTGLCFSVTQAEVDAFEHYVLYAAIKGKAAFFRPFTVPSAIGLDVSVLNQLRERVVGVLDAFLSQKSQPAQQLLQHFTVLLQELGLVESLDQMTRELGDVASRERQAEVWKAFCSLLEDIHHIFGQEKMSVEDFLRLLVAGMQASQFRTVPATVDVVQVKSYDMVEPHAASYVFAIGLTASQFPRSVSDTGLLTEEEKAAINEASHGQGYFDLAAKDRLKRNHRSMLSLLHAARKQLVLSAPTVFKESEEGLSPYLLVLRDMGIPIEQRGRKSQTSTESLGHYKGLLSQVIALNQQEFSQQWSKEEETFWAVAVRYLRRKLEQEGLTIPGISRSLDTQPLTQQTLTLLYPTDQPIRLSASSLTDFYQNEYLYFVRHVLRLQEQTTIQPDARSHGTFLHRIFERVTQGEGTGSFDERLEQAIRQTKAETGFAALYQSTADGQFSQEILTDIARATSLVLRQEGESAVVATESSFVHQLEMGEGRKLEIVGKIDRLDQLLSDQTVGVVDYKSSDQSFKLGRFYNGLSPQLVTYLAALSQLDDTGMAAPFFGAMYLHLQEPLVRLAESKGLDFLLAEAYKPMVYKGLFREESSNRLSSLYHTTKANLYPEEEMAVLLAYNTTLYQKAARRIVTGQFAINPYTENGLAVLGPQLKSLTGFEAKRHMTQARLLTKGGKREEWIERMKGEMDS